MSYSPEHPQDSTLSSREHEEQYDFYDRFAQEKEPINKFSLPFGEEALFDSREPHILEIYGGAQTTAATIHFAPNGTILDVSIRGPFTNEAETREAFRS